MFGEAGPKESSLKATTEVLVALTMGSDDETDLAWFKAGSIVVLALVSAVGVYGGFRMGDTSAAAALGNCFAGGVLLATALVHMLSDAVEGLDGWVDLPVRAVCVVHGSADRPFPFAAWFDPYPASLSICKPVSPAGPSVRQSVSPSARRSSVLSSTRSCTHARTHTRAQVATCCFGGGYLLQLCVESLLLDTPAEKEKAADAAVNNAASPRLSASMSSRTSIDGAVVASPALTFTSPPEGYRASHGEEGHSHDDPLGHMPSALAVLIALTVHSLLEGLAIGVQSSVDSTFLIAAAVLLHKGFAAFALGAAFRSVLVGQGTSNPSNVRCSTFTESAGFERLPLTSF